MHRFLIFIAFLISCQSSPKNNEDSEQKADSVMVEKALEGNNELPLDSFQASEFPEEIDGCSCYYWMPDQREKFIYVDDYARTAFIKVNGYFEKMEIYDVYADGDVIQQKCRSEHWGLTIDMKSTGQIDETTQYSGTLKIAGINGTNLTVEIKGECGC